MIGILTKDTHKRVKIRRNIGREVRPGAEQMDGKVFLFRYGWMMSAEDPYPGEIAWIPMGLLPKDAPLWIASGDLEDVA